ncbi:MAG: right-handed parallel beta-helix repeat-containing protein [Pirellulales bacterium]
MRTIAPGLQLGWAVGVLLLGTAARGAEYHVSPGGSSAGDGSPNAPWDLQTALAGAADAAGKPRIGPGGTVWLHGGTYRGGFASKLEGTQESPVTVRQATGERAIIDTRPRDERDDGLFNVDGDHSVFWGFEVTCSDPRRETKLSGSWPDDIRRGGLFSRASHVKFINLIVHDTAGGFGFWSAGTGGEVYGCLIYHNGWKGPDRGHGHAIYAQNRHGTKRLIDNVMFNQFGYGIHCYGSEKAFLSGFLIEGNASFNNGCLANLSDRSPGIMVGGGTRVERVTIKSNYTYGGSLQLGYYWGGSNADATVEDNYIAGGLYVRDFEQLTFQGNTIVGQNTLVRF